MRHPRKLLIQLGGHPPAPVESTRMGLHFLVYIEKPSKQIHLGRFGVRVMNLGQGKSQLGLCVELDLFPRTCWSLTVRTSVLALIAVFSLFGAVVIVMCGPPFPTTTTITTKTSIRTAAVAAAAAAAAAAAVAAHAAAAATAAAAAAAAAASVHDLFTFHGF